MHECGCYLHARTLSTCTTDPVFTPVRQSTVEQQKPIPFRKCHRKLRLPPITESLGCLPPTPRYRYKPFYAGCACSRVGKIFGTPKELRALVEQAFVADNGALTSGCNTTSADKGRNMCAEPARCTLSSPPVFRRSAPTLLPCVQSSTLPLFSENVHGFESGWIR